MNGLQEEIDADPTLHYYITILWSKLLSRKSELL